MEAARRAAATRPVPDGSAPAGPGQVAQTTGDPHTATAPDPAHRHDPAATTAPDPARQRHDPAMAEALEQAAALLARAERVVVFTGAGVSTESGIPDFRSPGGLWSRYDPRQLGFRRYVTDPGVRRLAWRLRRELQQLDPRPNRAHLACVRLAEAGRLAGVITQNVDGLHTDAGLDPELVCEVHGTGRQFVCLACGDRGPMRDAVARVEAGQEDPACLRCGGIIKAATVSFGQNIPAEVWARAEALTAACDAFLAVGSSLVVQPAAGLPRRARRLGATLVIVNREPTPLDDLADAVLNGEAGVLLPALVEAVVAGGPRT
jgi:NAD-dependent deacetylase